MEKDLLTAPVERVVSGESRNPIWRKLAAVAMLMAAGVGMTSDVHPPESFVINNPEAPVPAGDELVIMSANLHGGKTVGDNEGFPSFEKALEAVNPDVVCLQEFIADRDKVARLVKDFGYNIVFAGLTSQWPNRQRGNAILSKAPIELKQVVSLRHPVTAEPRNGLVADIVTPIGLVRTTGTHLSVDPGESQDQAVELNSKIYGTQILCGDLNTSNTTPFIGKGGGGRSAQSHRFISSTPRVPTFPNIFPRTAIDHIFGCGDISNVTTVGVGSDHRAIIARMSLEGCQTVS